MKHIIACCLLKYAAISDCFGAVPRSDTLQECSLLQAKHLGLACQPLLAEAGVQRKQRWLVPLQVTQLEGTMAGWRSSHTWCACTHQALVTILASQAWLRQTHAVPACARLAGGTAHHSHLAGQYYLCTCAACLLLHAAPSGCDKSDCYIKP